uniref:EMB1030 (EMBRYO DEFECTIVE 1030) n=1 Tax=Arundo donax TaxID=35708 RepID=A0A0A9F9C5_ARUDO
MEVAARSPTSRPLLSAAPAHRLRLLPLRRVTRRLLLPSPPLDPKGSAA